MCSSAKFHVSKRFGCRVKTTYGVIPFLNCLLVNSREMYSVRVVGVSGLVRSCEGEIW
jgi:hypothetical protein